MIEISLSDEAWKDVEAGVEALVDQWLVAEGDAVRAGQPTAIFEDPFPFHRFAQIVKGQVSKLKQTGSREVAFRVSVKDGKVAFTARGVKGSAGG